LEFRLCEAEECCDRQGCPANAGDVWTWTAIDADTKLMPSWFVGGRDSDSAMIFVDDLASRLANRVQLTSDGHKAYRSYSPAECTGILEKG
jgi:transposase-like protein